MPLLKVLELRLYKEKSSPEHEYIIAKISQSQWSYGLLRIDRCVDLDGKPEDATQNAISSKQSKSSLASSASASTSSQLSGKADAWDMVSTIHGGEWPSESSHILIEKAVCESNCPAILLHLAILARIVHDDSPKYHTFRRQCYWYADTIMRIFQYSFPGITSRKSEASGTWNHITIHNSEDTNESRDMIDKIKFAFEQRREYVDELVRSMDQLHRHHTGAHNGQYRSREAKSNLIVTKIWRQKREGERRQRPN